MSTGEGPTAQQDVESKENSWERTATVTQEHETSVTTED